MEINPSRSCPAIRPRSPYVHFLKIFPAVWHHLMGKRYEYDTVFSFSRSLSAPPFIRPVLLRSSHFEFAGRRSASAFLAPRWFLATIVFPRFRTTTFATTWRKTTTTTTTEATTMRTRTFDILEARRVHLFVRLFSRAERRIVYVSTLTWQAISILSTIEQSSTLKLFFVSLRYLWTFARSISVCGRSALSGSMTRTKRFVGSRVRQESFEKKIDAGDRTEMQPLTPCACGRRPRS